jgi:hypothetical protein
VQGSRRDRAYLAYCCIHGFNGKLRDECLNETLFASLAPARAELAEWQKDYNSVSPRSRANSRRDRKTSSAGTCPRTACHPFNHQPNNARTLLLRGENQGSTSNSIATLWRGRSGESEFAVDERGDFHLDLVIFGGTKKTAMRHGFEHMQVCLNPCLAQLAM